MRLVGPILVFTRICVFFLIIFYILSIVIVLLLCIENTYMMNDDILTRYFPIFIIVSLIPKNMKKNWRS